MDTFLIGLSLLSVYIIWKLSKFTAKHMASIRKPFRMLIPRSFPRVFASHPEWNAKRNYEQKLRKLKTLPVDEDEETILREELRKEYIRDCMR